MLLDYVIGETPTKMEEEQCNYEENLFTKKRYILEIKIINKNDMEWVSNA